MKKVVALAVCLWLCSLQWSAMAQDYRVMAICVYNFTKYIQWPEEYKSGDFVIGVLGDSRITESLEKLTSRKTVGTQNFNIKVYNSVEEIGRCHMVFIPYSKSSQLSGVLAKVKGQSTLVMTEKPGMGTAGSSINFILKNGSWRFEMNQQRVESSKLKVSGELTRLAILVD